MVTPADHQLRVRNRFQVHALTWSIGCQGSYCGSLATTWLHSMPPLRPPVNRAKTKRNVVIYCYQKG